MHTDEQVDEHVDDTSSDDDDLILGICSHAIHAYTSFAHSLVSKLLLPPTRRHGGKRGRPGSLVRSDHWWVEVVPRLDDRRFKRYFRMPRAMFGQLAEVFTCITELKAL